MIEMMPQQRGRKNTGIVVGTMMDRQIPGVGDENAGH
jgi:hypothetical protein